MVGRPEIAEYGKKYQINASNAVEYAKRSKETRIQKRETKKKLREIFEAWGNGMPIKAQEEVLKKFGVNTKGKTTIECLMDFIGLKANDKKVSLADLLKLMAMYAKYTGQEPATEITANGWSVVVADKRAKDALEDL